MRIFEDVDNITFKKLMEDEKNILLDIRTQDEFDRVHMKGAKLIEFGQFDFEDILLDMDKEKTYLLYCRSGRRTAYTMELMKIYGFIKVYNLRDGIIKWNDNSNLICKEGLECSPLLAY